jgi:hypothetical protein
MKYYSTIRKNKIMSFAGKQGEPEVIMLSKISQTQKHNYFTFSLLFGNQDLKKKMPDSSRGTTSEG